MLSKKIEAVPLALHSDLCRLKLKKKRHNGDRVVIWPRVKR